jgi:hypothetical protein
MLFAPIRPLSAFARRIRDLSIRCTLVPELGVAVALFLLGAGGERGGSVDQDAFAGLVTVVVELAGTSALTQIHKRGKDRHTTQSRSLCMYSSSG